MGLHEVRPTELLWNNLIVLIYPIHTDDLLLIVHLLLSLIKLLIGRQIAMLARIVNRVILAHGLEPILACGDSGARFRPVPATGLGVAIVVGGCHLLLTLF